MQLKNTQQLRGYRLLRFVLFLGEIHFYVSSEHKKDLL